jgi:hypothetical protein
MPGRPTLLWKPPWTLPGGLYLQAAQHMWHHVSDTSMSTPCVTVNNFALGQANFVPCIKTTQTAGIPYCMMLQEVKAAV